MKLDKSRWSHWCYLLLFSANIVLALLLRWWPGRASARTVVLYGHKFSGNLLAIFEQARADGRAQEFVFLTMDPAYHRELARQGLPSVLGTSPACVPVLARMRALISDHGLHSLELMRRFRQASDVYRTTLDAAGPELQRLFADYEAALAQSSQGGIEQAGFVGLGGGLELVVESELIQKAAELYAAGRYGVATANVVPLAEVVKHPNWRERLAAALRAPLLRWIHA